MPKIIIDKDKCIGCGACTSVWDNIEIKETKGGFKAVAKKAEIDKKDMGVAKESADICPVDAIKIR